MASLLHSYLFLSLLHIPLCTSLLTLDLGAEKKHTEERIGHVHTHTHTHTYIENYCAFVVEYCRPHLLVLSEQSAGLLKYVFSLRFCVTCNFTLCLPRSGDTKHPHVECQHRPASGGRHLGSNIRGKQHVPARDRTLSLMA